MENIQFPQVTKASWRVFGRLVGAGSKQHEIPADLVLLLPFTSCIDSCSVNWERVHISHTQTNVAGYLREANLPKLCSDLLWPQSRKAHAEATHKKNWELLQRAIVSGASSRLLPEWYNNLI